MHRETRRRFFGAGVVFLLITAFVQAQTAAVTLSGTVNTPSGTAVSAAKVTIRNATTGKSLEGRTDAAGKYGLTDLTPGHYQVSVSAESFSPKATEVDLTSEPNQTLDVVLTPLLSIEGLGFPASQTKGSSQEQALLDRRTRMLKTHQRLGLITTAPLLATVISGSFAGGKSTSSGQRDLHVALGSVTTGLYFTTAYYAIRAPKIPGTKAQGPIRLHKTLAWVHGTGMVLTPILGAMAFQQKSNGEKIHGIASAHAPVAYTTAVAYGIAILSVSLKKF